MLILFTVDQTTGVLETTKVKNVLQGKKIQEGATVLVEFGKEVFEANVMKLHGKSKKLYYMFERFLLNYSFIRGCQVYKV